eukprot:gene14224-18838_t
MERIGALQQCGMCGTGGGWGRFAACRCRIEWGGRSARRRAAYGAAQRALPRSAVGARVARFEQQQCYASG